MKLLGELLLDRSFYDVMNRYIASPENLLMVMAMLKESSKNIQFEAFHVFKVDWCGVDVDVVTNFDDVVVFVERQLPKTFPTLLGASIEGNL